MCILFVYTDPKPPKGGYKLIIASNRDEYYKRPAKKAFLCPDTKIIGGRDMEPGREGGMWLGVSLKPDLLKFGALLNVTGEKRPATSGRGPLVYNYLDSHSTAPSFVQDLQHDAFSAFNLFMLELSRGAVCAYHHSNSPIATYTYEGAQVLAFGNSTPNSPFTKVKKGRERFEKIIKEADSKTQLIEKLVELLRCRDLHLPDEELERRAPWGVNFLSSIFVDYKDGGYGTRTHSIVFVDHDDKVEFFEYTMREPIDPEKPHWDITQIKSQL